MCPELCPAPSCPLAPASINPLEPPCHSPGHHRDLSPHHAPAPLVPQGSQDLAPPPSLETPQGDGGMVFGAPSPPRAPGFHPQGSGQMHPGVREVSHPSAARSMPGQGLRAQLPPASQLHKAGLGSWARHDPDQAAASPSSPQGPWDPGRSCTSCPKQQRRSHPRGGCICLGAPGVLIMGSKGRPGAERWPGPGQRGAPCQRGLCSAVVRAGVGQPGHGLTSQVLPGTTLHI